ncbi:MAG: hypothetical protein ACRDLB_05375, partial [Actinomycetota bacterium]
SYFYGDPRRKIRDLLRETDRIETERFPTMLEAEIAETRAIAREQPPYNRSGKRSANWYLKVALRAKVPKIAPARVPKDDGGLYVGPLASIKAVRLLIDALRDATGIHRCTEPRACNRCAFHEFGTCAGPDPAAHRREVRKAVLALTGDHGPVLGALARRMHRLAGMERFEEAAEVRERALALQRTLESHVEVAALIAAGDVALLIGSRVLLLRAGVLVAAADGGDAVEEVVGRLRASVPPATVLPYLTHDVVREARVTLAALKRRSSEVRLLFAERAWVLPVSARPTSCFVPSNADGSATLDSVEQAVDRLRAGARSRLRV